MIKLYLIHTRKVYNLINFLGDLGGVIEDFIYVFGCLIFPISRYSFEVKLFEKLYLAKTKNPEIFEKSKEINKKAGSLPDHHPVVYST